MDSYTPTTPLSDPNSESEVDSYFDMTPRCFSGHPLILFAKTDPNSSNEVWQCDGAIFAHECLRHSGNQGIFGGNSSDQSNDDSCNSSKSSDEEETVEGKTDENSDMSHTSNIEKKENLRYRCAACDFDLCETCFQFRGKQDDLKIENDTHYELEQDVKDMIVCFQNLWKVVPSYPRNAYKRSVHLSGCTDAEERCEWLMEHYGDSDDDLDAPLFVKGDLYDEDLLDRLELSNSGFSTNAYKRALFCSGNRDSETALEWLRKNAEDPLLDSPVNPEGRARQCSKGHVLVAANHDSNSTTRWICDGEDDEKGCQRGVTGENYMGGTSVNRYTCEVEGCYYNVCDNCIFQSKSRLSEGEEIPNEIAIHRDDEADDNDDDVKTKKQRFNPDSSESKSHVESFQFINLNNSVENIQHYSVYQPWKESIERETQNAKITSFRIFKSPLQALPRKAGKAVMNLKFPGYDHRLHHQYVVLTLEKNSGEKVHLSIEKDLTGILAQMHTEFDHVAKYRLSQARLDPEEITCNDLTGIHRLEYVNLPAIGNLLSNWEVQDIYNLWKSNCQTLARNVAKRMIDASNGFTLHLPGTLLSKATDTS